MTHNSESLLFASHAVAAAVARVAEDASQGQVSDEHQARLAECLEHYGEALLFTSKQRAAGIPYEPQ